MPKSRTDYIREELTQNFEQPAAKVASNLAKKGISIDPKQVYKIRNQMRSEMPTKPGPVLTGADYDWSLQNAGPRENKPGSLGYHVIQVLKTKNMTDQQIMDAVTKVGYRSNSADFLTIIRQKLYDMLKKKQAFRDEKGQYQLAGEPLKQVEAEKAVANNGEYLLLREAICDLATARGIPNPQEFPDKLIEKRRNIRAAIETLKQLETDFSKSVTSLLK